MDNSDPIEFIVWALNQHLLSHKRSGNNGPAGHVICADGTRFSVQAGEYIYCTPRDNTGPWTHVEVMTPLNFVTQRWKQDDAGIGSYVPIQSVAHEIYERSRIGAKEIAK